MADNLSCPTNRATGVADDRPDILPGARLGRRAPLDGVDKPDLFVALRRTSLATSRTCSRDLHGAAVRGRFIGFMGMGIRLQFIKNDGALKCRQFLVRGALRYHTCKFESQSVDTKSLMPSFKSLNIRQTDCCVCAEHEELNRTSTATKCCGSFAFGIILYRSRQGIGSAIRHSTWTVFPQ